MSGHASEVREHIEIVGSNGEHVGTVDKVEGDRTKLTKKDDLDGSGQHHHFLPVSGIGSVDDRVVLNMPAAQARALATITGTGGPGMGAMGAG